MWPTPTRYLDLSDLVALFPWIPAGPVLDAGCGSGTLARALAAHGLSVEAVDRDSDTLATARHQASGRIAWQADDIRAYPLARNRYAAIFCLNLLPFIPDDERPRLLGRFKAALKPGGLLVLSGFNSRDPSVSAHFARQAEGGEPLPTGILKDQELLRRFRSWEIWHHFEGLIPDNHPPAGPHIHGLSQLIARKPLAPAEAADWENLPWMGAGMGWRSPLKNWILQAGAVDFVEVMLDDYLDPAYDAHLASLAQRFPVFPHGVELSIGSAQGLNDQYVSEAARVVARCGSPWWSDHLCFTHTAACQTFALNPLPCTEEALAIVTAHVRQVRQTIPTPLLLENVAYYIRPGLAEMDEATFMRRLCEDADCGMLLDVANLYGNSQNLGLDPQRFIDGLPAERVVQVHLAGGSMQRQLLFDTHDRPVWQETWELLEYALRRCGIKAVSLERDAGYEDPTAILQEVARARKMMGVRLA